MKEETVTQLGRCDAKDDGKGSSPSSALNWKKGNQQSYAMWTEGNLQGAGIDNTM